MKWTITRIDDADYGCEERMPGEPLMVLVSLECEDYRTIQFEMPDEWLVSQGLDEGDEWPEDIDEPDLEAEKYADQMAWMENYLDALNDLK